MLGRDPRWIHEAQQDKNAKASQVVTGQGKIHEELPRWCDNMSSPDIQHLQWCLPNLLLQNRREL